MTPKPGIQSYSSLVIESAVQYNHFKFKLLSAKVKCLRELTPSPVYHLSDFGTFLDHNFSVFKKKRGKGAEQDFVLF